MFSTADRSNGTKWSDPGLSPRASSTADLSWSVSFRATAMAQYPASVSLRAIPKPNPLLPPVTTTLRRMPGQFACRRHFQRRDETDGRRNLVCGEVLMTDVQDLAL